MQRGEPGKAWQAIAAAPLCLVLASPLAFAGDGAASESDQPPSVGGDVSISVKTGSVTASGSEARNCIGSMPEGHVAGDVSITVNGEAVSGNHGCVTEKNLSAE